MKRVVSATTTPETAAVAAATAAAAEAAALTATAAARAAAETAAAAARARLAATATAAEAVAEEAATTAEEAETKAGAETAAEAEPAAAAATAEADTAEQRTSWPLDVGLKQIVNHIMALTPAMDIAARRFWPPSGWTLRAGEAMHTISYNVYHHSSRVYTGIRD